MALNAKCRALGGAANPSLGIETSWP